MPTLKARIERLEQSAPGPDVAETELSPEENRRLLERLRGIVADGERFEKLPAEDQLAELLARRPSPPDPAALASVDLGVRLKALTQEAGVRIWETSVRLLREQIASGAAPGSAQRGSPSLA